MENKAQRGIQYLNKLEIFLYLKDYIDMSLCKCFRVPIRHYLKKKDINFEISVKIGIMSVYLYMADILLIRR